jgi:hypothetical protein
MSRKHFRALADALKSGKPTESDGLTQSEKAMHTGRVHQWRQMVESVATVCGQTNGEFKRSVFLEACGF